MRIGRTITAIVLTAGIGLVGAGAASASTGDQPPADQSARIARVCERQDEIESRLAKAKERVEQRLARLQEAKAKAEQAGRDALVKRIDHRISVVQQHQERLANRTIKVQTWLTEHC